MIEYQITLFSETGKYKPVSAIIKREQEVNLNDLAAKKQLVIDGTTKICQKRLWQSTMLKQFGYNRAKVRVYDKAKIEQENKERYEKIKEAKYASGEWKRPKKEGG